MITSSDNSKLSLVRKLQARKWREREGAFVTEGEDLLEAGRAAGLEPREVLVPAGSGLAGDEVEPDLLASISALGSGTRVIAVWAIPEGDPAAGAVYLHGVSDPGNVGTIVRTAAALSGGAVVIGPGSADPYSPKAVRATMGALFAVPPVRGGLDATPAPRLGLVAHGGEDLDGAITELIASGGERAPTLCLGGERDGLPGDVIERCDAVATIPVRSGAESLNVAAAAAIGLQRISSLAAGGHD
ncbi:MAG: RNA methyltransferase [Solirubrobacterales bacterium]